MGCLQKLELRLPEWVPEAAENYLSHTVMGNSIRALARHHRQHPSTILRQVRRVEASRDDPLIDAALSALHPAVKQTETSMNREGSKMPMEMETTQTCSLASGADAVLDRAGQAALRRLCERGAVLAVARDMETAVVVREDNDGQSLRTATVERSLAQAMALKSWINCDDPTARIARYFVTAKGRRALRDLTAQEENRAQGFGENVHDKDVWDPTERSAVTKRYVVTENPIMALSRRRDKEGQPFISKLQLGAGERLRQDYELSGIFSRDLQDCIEALEINDVDLPGGVQSARGRLLAALRDLGPGLSEVALECCCLLNGLEVTEKKMGWSSRSGKIVLRIALTRLMRHYEATEGKFAPLIG